MKVEISNLAETVSGLNVNVRDDIELHQFTEFDLQWKDF